MKVSSRSSKEMVIDMDEHRLRSIEQLQGFLAGTLDIEFAPHASDEERYAHISRVLKRFDYPQLSRSDRGVVLAYLRRTTSYSRAQLTRLVCRWTANRLAVVPLAKLYSAPAAAFATKYTTADVDLLVEIDKACQDVCGPAVVHLLKRAYTVYGDARYERLSTLSSSHLYNLRKSRGYQNQRTRFAKTRPVVDPIGVRRAPRASVVRKHMGYSHIPQQYAKPINDFYAEHFNPWLNLHRPCMYATEQISAKGKITKKYRHADVKTPLECLALLAAQKKVKFKAGMTLAYLQTKARAQTDLQATQEMQSAKAALFELFNKPRKRA